MGNIYQKLAQARLMLKQSGLKQTGENKYAGYKYFELGDFLPRIAEIEAKVGILSVVSFGSDMSTLTVFNADDDKGNEQIVFCTPMGKAEVKGCQDIQNLGAAETYIRRYLYNTAYEIVECDALNATQGKPEDKPETKSKKEPQKKASDGQKQEGKQVVEKNDDVAGKAEGKRQTVRERLVALGATEKFLTWATDTLGKSLEEIDAGEFQDLAAIIRKQKDKQAKEQQQAFKDDTDDCIPFK
jgi:hypothetical protein